MRSTFVQYGAQIDAGQVSWRLSLSRVLVLEGNALPVLGCALTPPTGRLFSVSASRTRFTGTPSLAIPRKDFHTTTL
jgi:hypothetical protein